MLLPTEIPAHYQKMSDMEVCEHIREVRKQLGSKVIILTHHYQRPEIVAFGDARGDSLKLAQFAASTDAEFIVYCGVHFMAETADILKKGSQKVILPDLGAGCDMADMAEDREVRDIWDELVSLVGHSDISPVTYINSTAEIKAFVGEKNGFVCTSSNAEKIIRQAFTEHKLLFFFPDQHLGRNTCLNMGFSSDEIVLWQKDKKQGGLSSTQLASAKVFLWQGHCPVHLMFTSKQVDNLRIQDPLCKIIVHPECDQSVVAKADFVGSTEYIVNMIMESLPGSHWGIGTEMNLVQRLILENKDKNIVSLNPLMCLCGTMNRISIRHLALSLDSIVQNNPINIITVSNSVKSLAKKCLDKMLFFSR